MLELETSCHMLSVFIVLPGTGSGKLSDCAQRRSLRGQGEGRWKRLSMAMAGVSLYPHVSGTDKCRLGPRQPPG